jgi:hypothetical protein
MGCDADGLVGALGGAAAGCALGCLNPLKWFKGSKLTPNKVRNYLSKVDKKTRSELARDIESIGLKLKGKSSDGRFMEFVDRRGNVRVKIHPPDKRTKYDHMHIYDSKGNPLDKNLNRVNRRSEDAHIRIKGG